MWKPYSHYLCTLVVFNFITNGLIEFSQKLMSAKPTWIKDLSIQEVFEEFWTIGFGICYQDLTILIRVSFSPHGWSKPFALLTNYSRVLDAKTFSLCTPTFAPPFISIPYQEDNKKRRDSKQENKTKKPKQEKVESLFE